MAPKRSFVWEHFDKVDKDSVMCRLCKKKFKFHNNTSNMKQHLKSKHLHTISIYEENEDCVSVVVNSEAARSDVTPSTSASVGNQYQPDASASSSVAPSYNLSNLVEQPPKKRPRQLKLFAKNDSLSDIDKKSIDRSLVKMIGNDLQPLSIVENKGFIEYTHKLQPLYSIPSRKVLTNTLIPNTCNEISTKIKLMLSQTENVGITTDIWSSDSNKSFITVTCHYIYDDIQENAVLETREIPGSHTGANIATSLRNILSDWEITDKVVAIITDNGANIKSAVNDYFKKTQVPCVAHTLNLCVTDAIADNVSFKETVKKSKNIVTHFKSSNLAADKLRELQTQMNLPQLRVKQDVSTRWNSTLIMINRLLEVREPLSAAMSHLPKAPDALDASEWHVLSDCTQVLQPLETMTEEMSGEKYPTMSMVIPLLRSLEHAIKNTATETAVGFALKNKLLEVISRRFSGWETNKTAAKATFLDPRFMKSSYGLDENAERLVIEELEYLIKKEKAKYQSENVEQEEDDTQPSEDHSGPNKKKEEARKKLWKWVDSRVDQKKNKRSSSVVASTALIVRHYLELPEPDRWKNPLPFCSKYKTVLPEIYQLQKKYLCLPATSVPSERLFSKAGQVANDRRNRLKSENINNILFLNSNMK